MVTYLLGTEEIETELEELVLEKTEGVPFFIEEFIKSLKDLGIIERKDGAYCLTKDTTDVTIPGTIQDVIMARVDSLPDAAKGVLQTGSVIEREFSYELIKGVTGISKDELWSHLSALKDSELLYERGIYPQSTYIFKHALTREVVYDSILAARKKRLHAEIGDAIEETYRDNLDEHYQALAGHYVTGENYQKGAEYCQLAAKKSEDAASFPDATAYGEKRVACLERLPRTEEVDKKIIDARATLGLYYGQMFDHLNAQKAVEPIVELALERGYRTRLAQIYTIIGAYSYMVEEDFAKAFKYLEDALELAGESSDTVSLLLSNFWLGLGLGYNCEFEKGLYHLERAWEINVAANSLWGMSAMKSGIAAYIYHLQGKVNPGYETSDEALRIAEESGDIFSKAHAHLSHGASCYDKRSLDEAEGHLVKAVDYCQRTNMLTWGSRASHFLGETYFQRGEHQESQGYYDKAIWLGERSGILPSQTNLYKIARARAKVISNDKDIDLESLYRYEAENKAKAFDGWMARYIGEILLNIDDQHMSEAEDWVKKAIKADKRNGMMLNLGWDYASYADLLKRKGDLPGARESLNKAIEIYKECGADGWLKKAEEALTQM